MKNNPFISVAFCLMIFLLIAAPIISQAKASANDACDLARDVAARAVVTFKKNQEFGLKLFHKALSLCRKEPEYTYNLGIAYFRYGLLGEAEKYLAKAVDQDGDRSMWLNNLAAVMLTRGSSPDRALIYAEKAANLARETPAVQDTLARARLANGNRLTALETIHGAKQKWSKNQKIAKSYENILEAYLSYYLSEIKAGRQEAGLAGLEMADFEPKAIRAYCLALSRLGKSEAALKAAFRAQNRFKENPKIQDTLEKIVNRTVNNLYFDFKAGYMNRAVTRARKFAEQYRQIPKLKEAYDKLLDVFLDDVKKLEIPETKSNQVAVKSGDKKSDELLEDIGDRNDGEPEPPGKVDIEENIPKGKPAGEYDIAVLVGNQNYKRTYNVDFAHRDLVVVRDYLIKTLGYLPDNIIEERDATKGVFEMLFGTSNEPDGKLFDWVKPGESRVFIYYVGHGAPDIETQKGYFVPVDADPGRISITGYPRSLFYRNLKHIRAKEMIVVLDTCFSGDTPKGFLIKDVSPIGIMIKDNLPELKQTAILTSARSDQLSSWYRDKRHSLFTYFFLKGLQGEADANKNRIITIGEMETYLKKMVPYWARRKAGREQNPVIKGKKDFVLVRFE